MDVIKTILTRRSVRDFKSTPVPKETVLKILETATHCPSSGNSQPWEIFVAGGEVLEKIRKIYMERFDQNVQGKPDLPGLPPNAWTQGMQDCMMQMRTERNKLLKIDPQDKAASRANTAKGHRFYGAPVLVYLCLPRSVCPNMAYDLGFLTQNILLAAESFGVGSLVATGFVFHPDVLRQELGIPDDLAIVNAVALGYTDTQSVINSYRSSRRPIQEVVRIKGL